MKPAFNYRLLPSTVGSIISVLLMMRCVISALFGQSSFAEAANTVLAIVGMCLAVHLIRNAAAMQNKHVWNSVSLILLCCIPVLNLFITAYNLIFDTSAVSGALWITVVLLVLSFPLFFLYYFISETKENKGDNRMKAVFALSGIACAIYVIPRLLVSFGLTSGVLAVLATNPFVSLAVYVIDFVCFIILEVVLRDNRKNE